MKIKVTLPKAYKNVKVDDQTVKQSRPIIKFEPDRVHQIISEAIQKEVRELYKDELEQHQKTIEKQREEAQQAAAKEKELVRSS